ncbi:MAG: hypothetical protein A2X18_03100 [Bacteroidetes bacterium GWF2_40_14]|nr:MAG: hypothetical protein A2X18_03100 [Bacteroidetes bacterium GWF2_40_14]
MPRNAFRISQSFNKLPKTVARSFLLFFLLVSSSPLFPNQQQQTSNKQLQTLNNLSTNSEILGQFTAKLKSYPAFEMKFSMVVDGSEFEGVVQSQGESFRLTNSQLELYCNGTTKWIYNIDNKEITITGNDPSQTDLTENPMAFLTSLEKGYSYNEKPVSTTESGKAAWKIELKTVNKKLAYTSITLLVEKSSLKPLAVEYLAKNGTKHVARISYFLGKRPWPLSYFSFPESRMNGLSVTDLR